MRGGERAGLLSVLVSLGLGVSLSAAADETPPADVNGPNTVLDKAVAELAVPDSPAFAALDVTPNAVTRPGTSSALGVGLLQGMDANGHLQSGVAVDFAPYLLLKGDELTLGEYRAAQGMSGRSWKGSLSNIQLSVATAKGSDPDDKSVRVAVGVRYVIFDRGDPFLDLHVDQCVEGAFNQAQQDRDARFKKFEASLKGLPPQKVLELVRNNPLVVDESGAIENGVKDCRSKHEKKAIRASAWDVGIAPTWTSPTGSTSDLSSSGVAAWTSYSMGVGEHGQLSGSAKYRTKEWVVDPQDSSARIEQNSVSLGVRFRYGNEHRAFLAEGIYIDAKLQGRPADSSYRYMVGGEFKIMDSMWLQLLTGSTAGQAFKRNDGFVTSQLRWAFNSSSQLN